MIADLLHQVHARKWVDGTGQQVQIVRAFGGVELAAGNWCASAQNPYVLVHRAQMTGSATMKILGAWDDSQTLAAIANDK